MEEAGSLKHWFLSTQWQAVASQNTVVLICWENLIFYKAYYPPVSFKWHEAHSLALNWDYFQKAYRFVSWGPIGSFIVPMIYSLLLIYYVELSLWQVLGTLNNDMTACHRNQLSLAFYFHSTFIYGRDVAYLCNLVDLWQLLLLVYSFFISIFLFSITCANGLWKWHIVGAIQNVPKMYACFFSLYINK